MLDYEDVKFQNAAKEDLKLGDEEANKKLEKKLRTQFKPLTKWWKKLVGEEGNLEAVRVSNRLSSTPCVVVTSKCATSHHAFACFVDQMRLGRLCSCVRT